MRKRRVFWIALAVVGVVVLGGYIASCSSRSFPALTTLPADAEIGEGSAVVYRRGNVGTVSRLGAAAWGLEVAFRLPDGLDRWRPAALLTRVTAGSREVPTVRLDLEWGDTAVVLHVRQGNLALRLLREEGVWVDRTSAGRERIPVNGKPIGSKDQALRLLPGDYLTLQGVDLRIGKFRKLTPATLSLTTRRLCPLHGMAKLIPWRPTPGDKEACVARTVRGDAQLGLGGSFGLTKPSLRLTPSDGEPGILQAGDTAVVPLAPATDLMAEVEQMVAYLNAPAELRPTPRTHFEHSVTNVDSMVRSITLAVQGVDSTVRTVNARLHSPDGLAPALLGKDASKSLREALAGVAGVATRLADTSGTLVKNAGLEPAVTTATRSIARVDTTVVELRGHAARLVPRVQLAVDQVTSTMEGVQATVQSLKTAGEDVSDLKNTVTSKKVVWTAIGLSLISVLANLKYLF